MPPDKPPPATFPAGKVVQVGDHNIQINHFLAGQADLRKAASPTGWPLAEVTDPFALEVHRPVQLGGLESDLPLLPAYVSREHDQELAEVVRTVAGGSSGVAVLVGGSSTGKTRACWEALKLLRSQQEQWRLWHPIDPSRPEAALLELPSIQPWTVVWLNEAQFYLDATGGLGERVAAGLRDLLRDPARAPVLVLATLWPEFWMRLAVRPSAAADDSHAQARELLAGRDISVPAAFTKGQVRQLRFAQDPRLAQAAQAAEDGQVTQFLAGVPELMARCRNAPPAAAALISAAIDARRLGMGLALPLAFLEAAAPDYLTDAQWDAVSENWLEQALVYTGAPCNGIRGPLSRIRPRPANDDGGPNRGPVYRLADYLDQYGRHAYRQIPPVSFWDSAVRYAALTELPGLAGYAETHGQLRDAARLCKRAAAHGDTYEAANLVERLHSLDLGPDPARWAVTHARLDDPKAVVRLLKMLRKAGAWDQGTMLFARDPASHASLNDLDAVNQLIDALRLAGAREQATALAARAAAHASLEDPGDVARLLDALREIGAREQATALAARDPAAHANLALPGNVDRLVDALREAGAEDQADALAARQAASPRIDYEAIIAETWNAMGEMMRERSAAHHEAALATSDLDADISLADYRAIDRFVDELRQAATQEEKTAVTARAAEYVKLDRRLVVRMLVHILQREGAQDVAVAVAARAAQHLNLNDTDAVTEMLNMLRRAGAQAQAYALAERAVERVSLDDGLAVAQLLTALRWADAIEPAKVLSLRLPAHGLFDDLLHFAPGNEIRYMYGSKRDGTPAPPWSWDDLD